MENQQFMFFITHVESEKQFLKIWAQTDESLYQTITNLLRSLQDRFDYYGPSASSINLGSGTRCVARAMNNEFHRVKVINLRSDGMVLVQFLDYGRISFIPIINIRTMEQIPQAQELFALPDAATPFYLEGVSPIGGVWIENVITQIASILINKRFVGFCNTFNGFKTLKFTVMNEDFAQTLVQRNMAVYSSSFIPEMQQLPSIQPLRQQNNISNNTSHDQWRMNNNTTCSQKGLKTTAFKAIQLDIDELYDIKISHVEDGPAKFSVQLLQSLPYLEAMMKKINSQTHQPLQEPPIAGTVCLGRQTHPVNRLCRVVLNSPGDTSCKVYYADYGHHETLSFDNIYQIPDEFVSENIFSIRFTLSGIADWKISQEMKDYFQRLVLDKNLRIRVCKGPMSPLTQYCDLYLQDQCVKELLVKAFPDVCQMVYPQSKQLPVDTREEVYVTFVESTSKFFVQIEKDYKLLDDLMAQIETISRAAPKINPSQLRESMPCIALYDQDRKWYRASVLSKAEPNKVRVFYVDYGNEEIVTLDNLRSIPPILVHSVQKQAIKCSLHLPGSTNKELDSIFEELVIDKRLRLRVLNNTSNVTVVELYDDQNVPGMEPKNIAQFLLNDSSKKHEIPMVGRSYIDRNADAVYKPSQVPARAQNDSQPDRWNSHTTQDSLSSKFRKDNENEHRLRNGPQQQNNFNAMKTRPEQKRPNQIDRNTRASPGDSNRSRTNSVLGSDVSDKDSDTSSRSGGRKNGRNDRRDGDVNKDKTHGEQNVYQSSPKSTRSNQAPSVEKIKPSGTEKLKSPVKSEKELPKNAPLTSKIPPPNITIGAVKNCSMIYYINPLSFYLQFRPDDKDLFALMEKISQVYEKNDKKLQVSKIKSGLACIAQYSEDQQWYRAQILSVENLTAKVFFVDYGNVESVGFLNIREIEPEFLQLPAQAVHCKLFCCKSSWTKDDSNLLFYKTNDKDLEAEFVKKENDVYHILLKDIKLPEYINASFAGGVDLIEEKNAVRNKSKESARKETVVAPDYAPINAKWLENKLTLESEHDVTVSWFINPNDFYCQLISESTQFNEMMNEIQNTYVNRSPVTGVPQVGAAVVAVLDSDNVLYRAQILEVNKDQSYFVEYVDYGDRATVSPAKIFPVEKKYMTFPKHAIKCSLKDVAPSSGSTWSDLPQIQEICQSDEFKCFAHECSDNKYLVTLKTADTDIGSILVNKGFAILPFSSTEKLIDEEQSEKLPEEVPTIDIKLLDGQVLCVKVSSVESVKKFYVQLHTAEISQGVIDSYMSTKNHEMMPRPLSHEVCVGSGCLVYCKKKWRRGVVLKIVKAIYDIRLIDSGEHKKVALKNMLKLPGQLSVMQNQAIECELSDVSSSATANELFKNKITGQSVKIFVEKVQNNRLSVRLFNIDGTKLNIDSSSTEKISPVCSPLILSSSHEVTVTWINSASSLWLQRTADASLEEHLLNTMYDYYSQNAEAVTPSKNSLYAGLSVDGNYYRVKVTEILGDEVKVVFVDYGNIETIPVANIHALRPEFYSPYQLGIEVSLTVNLVGSNSDHIDVLEPLVKDKNLIATLYNVNKKWVAEMIVDGEKLSDKLSAMNVVAETKKLESFKLPEVEEMVVGGKYNVRISHMIEEVLWLHRVEELPTLNDLQARLQDVVSNTLSDADLEENLLCLAVNSCDKMWRRARVYRTDEDGPTVQFVDYGNMDAFEHGSNCIKALPEEWKAVRMFGVPCKLDATLKHEDYNMEVCDKITDLMNSGVALQALIVSKKVPMRIDLFAEGQAESFCAKLIQEGLATKEAAQEIVPEEEDSVLEEEHQRDPRATYVSCSTSVDEFWVQDEKWVNELEMIEDRLMMSSVLSPVTDIKEGLMCIAQFPDDDKYYRATILSHSEEGTKVHFMDYGNAALTNDLKMIPDDLAKIRPLSRKCRLAKPEGVEQWPEDINDKFTDLSALGATIFILEVLEEGDTCLVKLALDGEDVASKLIKMCRKPAATREAPETVAVVQDATPKQAPEERPSPIGQEENSQIGVKCGVSYVRSLSDFWINKVIDYVEIEEMSDSMDQGDTFAPVEEIEVGKLLAAKYSADNVWYRSTVVSRDAEGTTVLFIDYGNTQLIKEESSLHELPQDLVVIPQMAHHCRLKLPEGFEDSASAKEKFVDLIDAGNTEFEMRILDESKEPNLVTLLLDGEDVIEILMSHEKNESKKSDDSGVNLNDNVKIDDTLEVSQETVIDEGSNKTDFSKRPPSRVRSSPSSDDKIVPASVSRGISVDEIDRFKPAYVASSPDERILPSTCNQGIVTSDSEPTNSDPEVPEKRIICTEVPSEMFTTPKRLSRDDKPVPGSVSRGESPVAQDRPETPKIALSEKLVAGVVNPPKFNLDLIENN